MRKIVNSLLWGLILNCMSAMALVGNPATPSNPTDTTSIDRLLKQAEIYIDEEKIDSAIICFDNILQIDKTQGDIYDMKAFYLNQIGKSEEALSTVSKAIQLYPDSILYRLNMCNILNSLNRYDEAMNEIDELIQKRGETDVLLCSKLEIYNYKMDSTSSIKYCDKIVSMKNCNPSIRLFAYSTMISLADKSSTPSVIKKMIKDLGEDNYDAQREAVIAYNSIEEYKLADKHKKKLFELREKYGIKNVSVEIDSYNHSNADVSVYEFFNPQDAGRMALQYIFYVTTYDKEGAKTEEYAIRVEHVTDYFGKYKSQMAVMATLKKDGFRTYWETFSELESTPYKQWVKFANDIIDGKKKVGSSTLFGSESSTIEADKKNKSDEKKEKK